MCSSDIGQAIRANQNLSAILYFTDIYIFLLRIFILLLTHLEFRQKTNLFEFKLIKLKKKQEEQKKKK